MVFIRCPKGRVFYYNVHLVRTAAAAVDTYGADTTVIRYDIWYYYCCTTASSMVWQYKYDMLLRCDTMVYHGLYLGEKEGRRLPWMLPEAARRHRCNKEVCDVAHTNQYLDFTICVRLYAHTNHTQQRIIRVSTLWPAGCAVPAKHRMIRA